MACGSRAGTRAAPSGTRYSRSPDRRVAATIEALSSVVQQSEETINLSVPQLCLRVLSFSGAFHTPPQIRDGLTAIGVQINAPNPLAVIHTTLARLVANEYVEARSMPTGGPPQYRITTAGRLALQAW